MWWLITLAALPALIASNLTAFIGGRYLAGSAFGIPGAWLPFRPVRARSLPVSPWARPAIAIGGLAGSYLCAAILFALGFAIAGESGFGNAIRVVAESRAEVAGLQTGDRVVRIDQSPTETFDQIKAIIVAHPGQALQIEVERDGKAETVSVTPGPKGEPDEGKIGIAAQPTHVDLGIGQALVRGLRAPAAVVTGLARGLVGTLAGTTLLGGPVGIVADASRPHSSPFGELLLSLGAASAAYAWLPVLLTVVSALFGWKRPDGSTEPAGAKPRGH